jgi:hypothetical protein
MEQGHTLPSALCVVVSEWNLAHCFSFIHKLELDVDSFQKFYHW